jgi:hypothetical protein
VTDLGCQSRQLRTQDVREHRAKVERKSLDDLARIARIVMEGAPPSRSMAASSGLSTRLAYGAIQLPRVTWYVGQAIVLLHLSDTARRSAGNSRRRAASTDAPVPSRERL